MACNGGGRAVDKHDAGITAEAFNHEVSGERVDVDKAGNIGGDVVGDGDAPRVIGALSSCHAPAEPMGRTRRPRRALGTSGPMRSTTPTPSKPRTSGNSVREA